MKWADQEKARKKLRKRLTDILTRTLQNEDGFARLRAIRKGDLRQAFSEARDWQAIVDAMPEARQSIFYAMRQDAVDVARTRAELQRVRRLAFVDELEIQAENTGDEYDPALIDQYLADLEQMSAQDAESIINTYNYDLAIAIANIAAGLGGLAILALLQEWEERRLAWKTKVIVQYTEISARELGQRAFYWGKDYEGYAMLEPRTAVCPICQGWIDRGRVPVRVAMNNPPPYHIRCPHTWDIVTKQLSTGRHRMD